MRTLIAGDWHLGTYSRSSDAQLAKAFLRRARASGDLVVLNGDIFEGVFEPISRAEAAHGDLAALIAAMIQDGSVRRTEGNHDSGAGVPELLLEHPAAGRVLIAHGHRVDPVHGSTAGRAGDGISRRFGHLAIVRGAAHAVEITVGRAASAGVDRVFQRRCREVVRARGCDLGVFGHIHRRYLVRDDSYANAGCLRGGWLEYLVLDDAGPRLARFGIADLAEGDAPGRL